jgi:hypothetical protein
VLLARCYGPVPLTIRIGKGPPNGRVAGSLTGKVPPNGRVAGVVPCDDKQHELTPAGLLMSRRDALSIQTGPADVLSGGRGAHGLSTLGRAVLVGAPQPGQAAPERLPSGSRPARHRPPDRLTMNGRPWLPRPRQFMIR